MSNQCDSFVVLIDAAKRGEASAIDQLISQFSNDMNRYVRTAPSVEACELSVRDICQMSWIRVLRYLPKFNGSADNDICIAKFRTWLKITTHSVLKNEISKMNAIKRGRSKQDRSVEPKYLRSDDRTPSSIIVKKEFTAKVREYMNLLDNPVQVECLKLRFYEGLKIGEIADKLDLSIDQVRYQIAKAIKFFKTTIDPLVDRPTKPRPPDDN